MIEDGLKLTMYFGERSRAGGALLADALAETYARHALAASVLLRGVEGYGSKQLRRTDRLLTLSEDLPLASAAVDGRARIEAVLDDVAALDVDGLVTLERAALVSGGLAGAELPAAPQEETKLTVYLGRHERAEGRPAHEAVVDVLHAHGVAGATVLLGVDGTTHGARHRAGLLSHNAAVPLMVAAVGAGDAIAAALPHVEALLERPVATLERVRVCKRDGARLAEPRHLPERDPAGLGVWQKLTVYAGEQSRHAGAPLHAELVRSLRAAGAAGATTLRGIWGYHGAHAPHGDTLWQLRRRVPVVTVVIDTPERMRRWFRLVDEMTGETGLVTSETVPALQVAGRGGLTLAELG